MSLFNYLIKAGTTDVSVVIRIIDSGDGTPETGVEHNTSGIDLEYRREGEASTDITEAALAALTTSHTDGGIEHIGNGYYRLDLPDAACAVGVTGVLVHGTITGMVVIGCYIQLVTFDPFDAGDLGLSVLSDAHSSLVVVKSQLLIVKSDTSDIRSFLVVIDDAVSDVESHLLLMDAAISDVKSELTTEITANISDIESSLVILKSDTLHIESDAAAIEVGVSDTESALVKVYSDTTAIEAAGGGLTPTQSSQLARIQSDVIIAESNVLLVKSDTSDIRSALVVIASDAAHIESDAAAIEVGVSDTESALVKVYSDTTHIDSDVTLAESRLLVVKSDTSDILSDLVVIASQLDAVPTATENADALLKRDMSAVTGESARSPLNALRALRNKVSISAGTMTVTKEDDSTSAWTATVTTDSGADPVTAIDPA